MEFGYNPPVGERNVEIINPRTFVEDYHRVCDVAAREFDTLWVSDHLQTGSSYRLECWSMVMWTAAKYPTVKVGTIVMANSFRNPALMAKMAATAQVMSGGRLILGNGAGWMAEEYRGYGFPFPATGVRLAMLDEGLHIMRQMWTNTPFSFAGTHYQLEGAYCEPKPPTPPLIMIGGSGERVTMRLTAKYADWWNDLGRPIPDIRRKVAALNARCAEIGRDPASVKKTLIYRVYINRNHRAAIEQAMPRATEGVVALIGDPSAIVDQLREVAAEGIEMCQLVFPNFPETDDMRLFIDEVAPHVR